MGIKNKWFTNLTYEERQAIVLLSIKQKWVGVPSRKYFVDKSYSLFKNSLR